MAWFRRRRGRVKPGAGYKKAFRAVHERVDHYRLIQDSSLAMDPAALVDAAVLWRAAQPADPHHSTDTEQQRLATAYHLLGWFHTVRYVASPADCGWADLAQALHLLTPFIRTAPETIPELFGPLIGASADTDQQFGIGVELLRHAMRYQDPAALSVAIELHTCALAAISVDHPDRAGHLNNLGIAHRLRFQQGGATAHLDAAIEYSVQAVTATPAGHADLATFQHNLDLAHSIQFERTTETATWDPAIERVHVGLALDHPDPAGGAAGLDAAIERGLQMMDDDLTDPGVRLSDLAYSYLSSFERDGIAASLDAAIDMFARALAATPSDDDNRAYRLADLSIAYETRFKRTGATTDLDAKINLLTNALAASSCLNGMSPRWLSMLCTAHRTRFEMTGKRLEHDVLLGLADQARQLNAPLNAPPLLRSHAEAATGRLARAVGEHAVAVRLFRDAVQELPNVARWELQRLDQEDRLGEFTDLVGEAIAAHLQVNDVAGAVETAELGRGVLLAAQLDTGTDVTDLRRVRPDLAKWFERLRDRLNATPPTAGDPSALTETTAPRRGVRVARGWQRDNEWRRLMIEIRRLEGFDQFLATPRWASLADAASGGAVVVVNASSTRADAILLRAGAATPVLVELDQLTLADVRVHAADLLRASVGGWGGSLALRRMLPDVLAWLWRTVAEPVLTALGHTASPSHTEPWPHVWWVPTGQLSSLPLHAAGLPTGESTLDRTISSYAPTIRALIHTRRRPVGTRRHLTVAMRHTPGHPDLPGTVTEAATLHARYPDVPPLIDREATTHRVLAALRHTTWAHFACHAATDTTAPSRSSLLLHDGPLTVSDIARLGLQDAELAYLSACSAARTGWRSPDEAIHLASAFQLAGYRHVIAPLWPLDDLVAAHAARRFYQLLPNTPDADAAAAALHQLTLELREQHPARPDQWAPLIHSGP